MYYKEVMTEKLWFKTFNEIDEKIVEAWSEDMTIGDLIQSFSKEQLELFYQLKLVDCGIEKTESVIDISVKLPEFYYDD